MRTKHKTIVPGGLLQVCWLIANAEAKNLGSAEILPIHFLLAVMKIIDPAFPGQLDALKISSDEWAAMCEEAQNIRRYIDVVPERVTNKRRGLRALRSPNFPKLFVRAFIHPADLLYLFPPC